jgi:hypothetical protein
MYLQFRCESGVRDEAIKMRLVDCLKERCQLCGEKPYRAVIKLANLGVEIMMGTPSGHVGAFSVPVCRGCLAKGEAPITAAIRAWVDNYAREKGFTSPEI